MAARVAFLLISLTYFLSGGYANTNYQGAKVFNVVHGNLRKLLNLDESAGFIVWSHNRTNTEFLVPFTKVLSVEQFLKTKKIPYSIFIDDVQKLIEEEKASTSPKRGGMQGFSLDNYNRLNDIYNWLDSLHNKYPNRVTVETIGYTYEKRPIKLAKVSSGVPGAKAVFLDGGIHAREWISTATVLYILNEVVENRSKLPQFMQNLDFYIMPVFNPDGYEYTHTKDRMWRKNRSKNSGFCVGTDLNRNFDIHFGGVGTSNNNCEETYRGPFAFSEPETKAFAQYIMKIRNQLVSYIGFHSYGQFILLPYAYDYGAYPPDYKELEAIGKRAAQVIRSLGGERYTVGIPADILYPAAGGAYDWVKEKAGVKYAFTYELRDTGRYGFLLPAWFIRQTAQEAFEGVKVMVEAAASKKRILRKPAV